jgi:uncharacterized protein (TIGR00251 family)
MLDLRADPRGVILPVQAHAGARRSAIAGVRGGMLRVDVTQAPEKGKANQAIIALLSRALGVPKSAIELVSGEAARRKRFLVAGVNAAELRRVLDA